jgi:serine/threonine protein kinase
MEVQYGVLKKATGNFAADRVLGEGSFATVYMGSLEGQTVAVKVEKDVCDGVGGRGRGGDSNSKEAAKAAAKTAKILEEQFVAELTCLYKYRHPNICTLMHHSVDGPTRCLVYEYCSNGPLFGNIGSLSWDQRLRVAMGVARGLAYLHSAKPDPIVHRDVKTANILLGDNCEAKVADFGTVREQQQKRLDTLALAVGQGGSNGGSKSGAASHMSTMMVVGTHVYMPPEYERFGHISIKVDSFAFGMVLLELLTGKRPDLHDLKDLVKTNATTMRITRALDEQLVDEMETKGGEIQAVFVKEALQIADIALKCLEYDRSERSTVQAALPELEKMCQE